MKMNNPSNRVRRFFTATCLTVCVAAMAGCTFGKHYSSSLPKNLQVVPEIDSGSRFTSIFPEFDVHRVGSNCELQYQGRVFLDKGKVDVGIPTDGLLYLEFIFVREGMLSNGGSVIRQGTLLNPRPGYSYVAKARYLDGIYAVEVQERSRDGSVKNLERVPLNECRE